MSSPLSAVVIGSTGLVGSHILTSILESQIFGLVQTIGRREPKTHSPILNAVVEPDTSQWVSALRTLDPRPTAVFSALGTTSAAAGGIANQWKIDHDLNVELAKAAKEAGIPTFVFISSAGTRGMLASRPYSRMKVGVEDNIRISTSRMLSSYDRLRCSVSGKIAREVQISYRPPCESLGECLRV
ncbi:hypothetical protein F5884DRAFT_788837 [Xylogone sp. PMI_703]|nr:hypothetical protein F5884DRAFT_788837 [Xylogone sp. PMI_703]